MDRNTAVANASPLIVLSKARFIHLLGHVFEKVLVPSAVLVEVKQGPGGQELAASLESQSWIVVRESVGRRVLLPTHADLGTGETEVLLIGAQMPGAWLLLDDRLARRCAAMMGSPVMGTLGVLAKAASMGLLDDFLAAVAQLEAAGLYVSPRIVAELKARTGKS